MSSSFVIGIIGFVALIIWFGVMSYKNRAVGPTNEEYYNEDGDHVYYDRKLIRYKQRQREKISASTQSSARATIGGELCLNENKAEINSNTNK